MKKIHQKELIKWLNRQSFFSKKWINFSKLFGIINGILIVFQTWILSFILEYLIINNTTSEKKIFPFFILLLMLFILRFFVSFLKEYSGFRAGKIICYKIRQKALDKLQKAGPNWVQRKSVGSWITLILEQIDNLQDYYSYYLPQITLVFFTPVLIGLSISFINLIAALILFVTAPLIPLFMIIVGENAADANRKNFKSLSRLGGYFLDQLKGIETLRIFGYEQEATENISQASKSLRKRTMKVLSLVFLSSGVLEFFSSISIALIAVYFGFSYLGSLNFNYYNSNITLFSGFFSLILSVEFFQPLRKLGTFYHAKAQAIGAADSLKKFFETPLIYPKNGKSTLNINESVEIIANNLRIFSLEGKILSGPLNFTLPKKKRIALVGQSGSGKSSLINVLLGFLPYTGSILVNNIELRDLNLEIWRKMINWIGQNPKLISSITLRKNILFSNSEINESELFLILKSTKIDEFLSILPKGLDTVINDQGIGLSIGQIQRISIARSLISPCQLFLMDEPTANIDIHTEKHILNTINKFSKKQSTIMITHQLKNIIKWNEIWVMENGKIIEKGSYVNLYKKKGSFYKFFTSNKEEF